MVKAEDTSSFFFDILISVSFSLNLRDKNPMSTQFDLLILGGGPGGYVSAIRAGQLGLKVAVIEKEAIGGTCLHHGCIPSKALIRNADVLDLIQKSDTFGIRVEQIQPDFGAAVDRSQQVLQKLYRGVLHLMKKNQVTVFKGFGKLVSHNQIEVTSENDVQTVSGDHIIIATGSRVRSLPNLPIDGERIITSDEALLRKTLPRSALIVGGGAIGVEFSYVYSVYGVEVSIAEMAPVLLPMEDHEVSAALMRSLKKRKIKGYFGTQITGIQDENNRFIIALEDKAGTTIKVDAEMILVAVGRAPNVEKIGLETLGIQQEAASGLIQVDATMRTNINHIYAIGDVSNRPALAHGAMAQGVSVVETIAGKTEAHRTLDVIPSAVYCHPQVASVGLTEQAARAQGLDVKIAKFPFSANGKAIALGETEGFVKIVADAKYGEVLGAHLIGADVTELIGEFVLGKTLEATAAELGQSVHPHPTLSEAVMEAGGAIFNQAIHF